jgi:hypothetical protein
LYHEMICKTIVTSYKFQKTSKLELETRPTITAIALVESRPKIYIF